MTENEVEKESREERVQLALAGELWECPACGRTNARAGVTWGCRTCTRRWLGEKIAEWERIAKDEGPKEKNMSDPMTIAEIDSLHEGLGSWGPVGEPNWADPKGLCIPVPKLTMERLLVAARRGVEAFAMDAQSHAEAHGVSREK